MKISDHRHELMGSAGKSGVNLKYWRASIVVLFLSVFIFVTVGYLFSDNRYADDLITAHHITSPNEAFEFVISRKIQAPTGAPVDVGQSFRSLMSTQKKWLWCDEGAIAIAILSQRLGYETRLVDLINTNTGRSGHTIVEVKIGNRWQAYDFSGRRLVSTPDKSVDYPSAPRYRVYPNTIHRLLLNNTFLRAASYAWRSRNKTM